MKGGPKTQIGSPYKTTKLKVVLTTQIGGYYKTNMWSYINDGSICATKYTYFFKINFWYSLIKFSSSDSLETKKAKK